MNAIMRIVLVACFFTAACFCNTHIEFSHPEVSDEEWQVYQGAICLHIFAGHIVLPALGHGSICGHPTRNCNQAYCSACAARLGVCEVCGRKNDWTKNTRPDTEVPLLFAILERSENLEARRVAIHALTQIGQPGTPDRLMKYSDDPLLSMQLVSAVGHFRDPHHLDYLKKVLDFAGDSYFGEEEEDTEKQYYLSRAAKAAAAALVRIGDDRALKILLRSAREGKLWERVFVLDALGSVETNQDRARDVLTTCLHEFFRHDREWKWIPGRDLIGSTLRSLARVGDRETAKWIIHYIRNPGCDFLYEDLRKCLAAVGRDSVEEITRALTEDLHAGLYDRGRLILVESLGDTGNPEAAPYLRSLLTREYPDEWRRRDFQENALNALGKLGSAESIPAIGKQMFEAKNELVRQAAAAALGTIGTRKSFDLLVKKLAAGDNEYITRECVHGVNRIAFEELTTDTARLKAVRLTARHFGPESAFELTYHRVMEGESWANDLFFEYLPEVPMRRNFHRVVELVYAVDPEAASRTFHFLMELTGLDLPEVSQEDHAGIQKFRETLWKWYDENQDNLNLN